MDARNRTSAARQGRGFRRHLRPNGTVVFRDHLKPRPSTPKFLWQLLLRIIDSLAVHAVHLEGGTWQITFLYRYSFQCDDAPAASRSFVFTWVKWNALPGWPYSFLDAFAWVHDLPSRHPWAPDWKILQLASSLIVLGDWLCGVSSHNCKLFTFQSELWGFLLVLVGVSWVVDSGSMPPFGKFV